MWRDDAYLLDILKACEKIVRYADGKSFDEYAADEVLRDAVERNIEIIGEAARKISNEFKQEHTEIPWRKIIAQRNVLIHEYGTVDDREIWEVVTVHVPVLIKYVRPLVPPA
jgi:uncharacterized protein with HEPN domain